MKQLWKMLSAVAIILTALVFSPYADADDTVVGRTPEGVYPMQESDVEMEAEDILVNLKKNTVECLFLFHNTGEAKKIRMGFPGKLEPGSGSELSDDVSLTLNDFKAAVNGKDLPVTYEKGIRSDIGLPTYSEWYTFSVPFQQGETVAVKNTYRYTPTYDSIGDVFTGYVLQTGATWKGPIGKAKVTFVLGSINPWQIERLNPGGFRFEGNTIVWERADFEPSYDLSILYNTWHYSDEFLKMFNGEETKAIQEKIDKYKELEQMSKRKESEKLYIEYVNAMEKGDRMLATYASSMITEEPMQDNSVTLGDILVTRISDSEAYKIECKVRSMYTPNITLRITHMENGRTVVDLEDGSIYPEIFFSMVPGIEYTVSVTATDWLDRIVKKEIRYKAPDTDSLQAIPSDPDPVSAAVSATVSTAVSGTVTTFDGMADKNPLPEKDQTATAIPASTSSRNTISSGKTANAQEEAVPYWLAIPGIAFIGVAAGVFILKRHRM